MPNLSPIISLRNILDKNHNCHKCRIKRLKRTGKTTYHRKKFLMSKKMPNIIFYQKKIVESLFISNGVMFYFINIYLIQTLDVWFEKATLLSLWYFPSIHLYYRHLHSLKNTKKYQQTEIKKNLRFFKTYW